MSYLTTYYILSVANPDHLAAILCPVLVCPEKAIMKISNIFLQCLALIHSGVPDSQESKYGGQSGVLGKSGDRALDWSGHGGKGPTTEPGTHCVKNPSKHSESTYRKSYFSLFGEILDYRLWIIKNNQHACNFFYVFNSASYPL